MPISPTTPPDSHLADVEAVEPTAPEAAEADLEVAEVNLPLDVASMSLDEPEGAVGGQVVSDENVLPDVERVDVVVKHNKRPVRVKQDSEYT